MTCEFMAFLYQVSRRVDHTPRFLDQVSLLWLARLLSAIFACSHGNIGAYEFWLKAVPFVNAD